MVYLEHKKIEGGEYTYLTKNVRISSSKWKKIRKYVSIKNPHLDIQKTYTEHKDFFLDEELKLRFEVLEKENIIHINKNILRNAIEIDNYLSIYEEEKNLIDVEFAKEFIYNSNKMEGSTLPKKEFLAIFNKRKVIYDDKNEVREAENSIKAWEYLRKDFSFNVTSIKKLYKILTDELLMMGKYKYPKGFKIVPNKIGEYETCEPKEVSKKMLELINWYRDNKKKLNPLLLAFEFYYRYERIHPFQDGNGRTGRMVMNKILLSNGYPPIIIYNESKFNQSLAFKNYIEGDKENFYEFLLDQTKKTYNHIYKEIISKK